MNEKEQLQKKLDAITQTIVRWGEKKITNQQCTDELARLSRLPVSPDRQGNMAKGGRPA